MKVAQQQTRRAVIYTRVSSEEQAQGHSLETQRRELTAWAERESWELGRVYEDAGVSGTSVAGRPAFRAMLSDAYDGLFDAVLVLRRDRFARNIAEAMATEQSLRDTAEVRVLSHDEPAGNDDTPDGFWNRGMSDLRAAHYSVELSEKTSAGWRTRAEEGLPAGDIPFAYLSTGRKSAPAVVEEEAVALRAIFERYSVGNASLNQLADWLNEHGHKPRSKRGYTTFGAKSVRVMLSNRFYLGDIMYKGERVAEGQHEPMIDADLFNKVQAVLKQRARRPRSYAASPPRAYILSGVAICAGCGGPLWVNSTKSQRHAYYRCSSRSHDVGCPDRFETVRGDVVEGQVAGLFEAMRLPSQWRSRVEELADCTDDTRTDPATLEARIERAREGFLSGVLDESTAKAAVVDAERELAAIRPAVAETVSAGESLADVHELWPHMTAEERRDLVRMTVDVVAVDLGCNQVVGVLPKDHFAPLFKVICDEEGAIRVADWPQSHEVRGWRPRTDSNRRSPP